MTNSWSSSCKDLDLVEDSKITFVVTSKGHAWETRCWMRSWATWWSWAAWWCYTIRCIKWTRCSMMIGEGVSLRISWSRMSSTDLFIIGDDLCLDLEKVKVLTSVVNVLSLSLSLFLCWNLKIKEDLIKGFPHTLWGLSLARTISCVLLSWLVFYVLYLCSIYSLS